MADTSSSSSLGIAAVSSTEFTGNANLGLDMYLMNNPMTIQGNILQVFENRHNGKYYLADSYSK